MQDNNNLFSLEDFLKLFDSKNTDIDKKNLIDEYAKYMQGKSLGYCIGSINSMDLTQQYIEENKDKLGEWGISRAIEEKESDDDKKILIDKFAGYMHPQILGVSISSINSMDLTQQYIEENIDILGEWGISCAIKSKKSDDDKKILIDKFAKYMQSESLGYCIGSINSMDLTQQYIEKYKEKLGSWGISRVIQEKKSDDEKKILIEKYAKYMQGQSLGDCIVSINSMNLTQQYIEKYKDKLGEWGIALTITEKKSDDNKISLIGEFADYMQGESLGICIGSINSMDLTQQYIEESKSKLGEWGISRAIKAKKSDDDKISLIGEYAKYMQGESLGNCIGSIKNVDLTQQYIEKYKEKLGSWGISRTIKVKKSDYEKKILIDEYAKYMQGESLGFCISSINSVDLTQQYIKDNLDKLGEWGIALTITEKKSDEDKKILIDKFAKYMDDQSLGGCIGSINSVDLTQQYIEENIDILGEWGISRAIKEKNSDDDKKILIDKFAKYMNNQSLGYCIGLINSIDLTQQYIEKYKDKLGEWGISRAIEAKESDDDKKILIDKFAKYMDDQSLGACIGSINSMNLTQQYIEENIDILGEWGISRAIEEKESDDDKKILIDEYAKYLDNQSLGYCIGLINSIDLTQQYIEKYKDKLGEWGISRAIDAKESDDDKKILIDEYAKYIQSDSLGYSIGSIKSMDLTQQYIEKYKDKLGEWGISRVIQEKNSDDDKKILIDKYVEYMQGKSLGNCIGSINNIESVIKCIKDCKEKNEIDELVICYIIQEKNSDDDKILLIDEFAENMNKQDLGSSIVLINSMDLKIKYIEKYKDKIDMYYIAYIYSSISNISEKNQFAKSLKDIYADDKFHFKQINNMERLNNSRALEVQHVAASILSSLEDIPMDEHDEIISKIERVFISNNLPDFAKLYNVFNIMHPDVTRFYEFPYQSPNLNHLKSPFLKQSVIFSDLFRVTIGSNNRSLRKYITELVKGNELAKRVIKDDLTFEKITSEEFEILNTYVNRLKMLYANSTIGKMKPYKSTNNAFLDLKNLVYLFNNNQEKFSIDDVPNRIIKMFGHYAGIDTVEELLNKMDDTIKKADEKNRIRAYENKFEIHEGDFIKGLANQDAPDEFYSFLTTIFQNGSLCKEFLGVASRSDTTPLDTDVSRLLEEPKSFEDVFTNKKYASSRYGPLWIVLKNDDRFNETTKEKNELIPGKLELFQTNMDGAGHYGIRTGFASSDIDFLVVDEQNIKMDRIKYEIAMNGFYIPVVNTKGNLVFTPDEYDFLRKKVSGLSYYCTEDKYDFAEELDYFDISEYEIDLNQIIKRNQEIDFLIYNILGDFLLKYNKFQDEPSMVELIDESSLGRGTNISDKASVDLVLRIDEKILYNSDKSNELKKNLDETIMSHFDEFSKKASIHISYAKKTNKMEYLTSSSINDRIYNINRLDRDKGLKVVQNILLAKYFLSDITAVSNYEKNAGLTEVAVENWILQNGGSFEKAARDFISMSEGKNFEQFSKVYTIWDFGKSKNQADGYLHEEYIKSCLNEELYNKMIAILKNYVNFLDERKDISHGKTL